MRITVDGKPLDDKGRSSADVQRCTDVALQGADIQFGFDNLEADRRLAVAAEPATVAFYRSGDGWAAEPVRFTMYANYSHFIERAEVRIFAPEQSLEAEPLALVAFGPDGVGEWLPEPGTFATPARELKYVLRAYGSGGTFDETVPQPLWIAYREAGAVAEQEPPAEPRPAAQDGESLLAELTTAGAPYADEIPVDAELPRRGTSTPAERPAAATEDAALRVAYGENELGLRNIQLASGSVTVRGNAIPAGAPGLRRGPAGARRRRRQLRRAGDPAVGRAHRRGRRARPARQRRAVPARHRAREQGLVLRRHGRSHVDEQRLERPDRAAARREQPVNDFDSSADARLAFYLNGKFNERWRLTASADTRDAPLEDLFSNFLDKSPDSLFRRIDPDYHFPTFGDDGTVEEMAPTLGKFYVKVGRDESYGEWGNFQIGYMNNELAQVDRGLYGAKLHYESQGATSFGERRFAIDGFTAEPGTIASREEFRGTGGSLYFLQRQDLLAGSERVRIEYRDRASGLVTGVVNLTPAHRLRRRLPAGPPAAHGAARARRAATTCSCATARFKATRRTSSCATSTRRASTRSTRCRPARKAITGSASA